MNLTRDYFSTIPIWVKFNNLSIELWTKDAICRIDSTLGTPIKMKNNTAQELRMQFARVLIEIDIDFSYPDIVKGTFSDGSTTCINISYEYRPKLYENCKVFGHSTKNCGTNYQQKWKPKETVSAARSSFNNILPIQSDKQKTANTCPIAASNNSARKG